MPVSMLYCEGGNKSADIRVISALVSGLCTVAPVGSKYGFGQRVRVAREYIGSSVAGLRDRDFDDEDLGITHSLRDWRVEGDKVWVGWCWERTTIENYLIDPAVVQLALGSKSPPASKYAVALRESAASVADYTAARIALSRSRRRFAPLSNAWGRERGRESHPFPEERTEPDCRKAITEIVKQHQNEQVVDDAEVLSRFEMLLPDCRPGGARYQDHLVFFSGKDLLFGLEIALKSFGLGTPFEFRERILKAIADSTEDIWTWLPEWRRLRELVRSSIP